MKQYITKEQWDEIYSTIQMEFIIVLKKKPTQITEDYDNPKHHPSWGTISKEVESFRPSIGQMIEFLGDDFSICKSIIGSNKWRISSLYMEVLIGSELCDLLWEAVKYKLKQ